ncbi:MAG TPA: 6-phosphogluconolactonase [Bacteroidales bacterium]|nr:6-phosphogluconolactonase [Bacteroidales bacterium]
MVIDISQDAEELGIRAALRVSEKLNEALNRNNEARIVLSTGSSQFTTLKYLLQNDVDWSRIEVFHLDEYIGLPVTHKASFRKYLRERFIDHLPVKEFFGIDVEDGAEQVINRLTARLDEKPVDVGLIGIGVNGHIAFNDPPANFTTRLSFMIVSLDEKCRMQQVDEGWFDSIGEVPMTAISMTPWRIMQCNTIISAVPYAVKAESIRNTMAGRVSELVPATILKQHPDFHLFIDRDSASGIIRL